MRPVRYWCLFLLFLASCKPSSQLPMKTPNDPCSQFEGTAMSAPYHVVIGRPLDDSEKKTIDATLQTIFEEIDVLFNQQNPRSEIAKLNAAPADVLIPLSVPMQDCLAFCGRLVHVSGGRFDPTIEPLKAVWKEALDQQKTPSAEKLQPALDALGWSHINIKNGIFRKDHPLTQIDLGGILKGRCIDWLAEQLQAFGYTDFFIEWGGEMRASGQHPLIGDWVVQINPHITSGGKPIAPVPLRNSAIAMSKGYEQKGQTAEPSPEGKARRYMHLIDPLSGKPLQTTPNSIASAVVLAPSCAFADALASAAMLFPTHKEAEKWAQEVVELYPNVSFWILSYKSAK